MWSSSRREPWTGSAHRAPSAGIERSRGFEAHVLAAADRGLRALQIDRGDARRDGTAISSLRRKSAKYVPWMKRRRERTGHLGAR